jgi:hypothetical protein
MSNTRSITKMIIGFLHDVVEDSDWELDDLRTVGFSDRVVDGVDAMTHRPGELYFDSIERCGMNADATDKKVEDLSHNMDTSRVEKFLNAADMDRLNKYMIARAYLVAIKKHEIARGTPMADFVRGRPDFMKSHEAGSLLVKYSSAVANAVYTPPASAGAAPSP